MNRLEGHPFASAAQQILKGSHVIKPVAPIRYRTPLEGFARIADAIHVVKYDRAAFPGGDIVRHFVETFIPEARAVSSSGGDVPAVNATISAEGMSILADYRGYDTLGETTVIFTAGIGVLLLLRGTRRRGQDRRAD